MNSFFLFKGNFKDTWSTTNLTILVIHRRKTLLEQTRKNKQMDLLHQNNFDCNFNEKLPSYIRGNLLGGNGFGR